MTTTQKRGLGPRRLNLFRDDNTGVGINIVAVMTSSVATGALGFVFWTIAARGYSTAEVGRASAIITSATLMATLSNLSLGSLYERFLPIAGSKAHRLITIGRSVIIVTAVLFGFGFVVLGPRDALFTSSAEPWLYPVIVAVLGVFAVQDQLLIGLGRSRTVALKNVTQSTIKLILVALLIPFASGSAIVAAWVIPAAVIACWIGVSAVRPTARNDGPRNASRAR